MDKVLLTAENIKDADEFVDAEGAKWWRNESFWVPEWRRSNTDTDETIASCLRKAFMRGAYVTRWKPGREPKAPQSLNAFRLGAVVSSDDVPPRGTVVSNGSCHVECTGGGRISHSVTPWVVVREAPPPPAEEPWRRVVVEVRGKGHDARVRIVGDRDGAGLYADAIAAYATPAPDRAKVREMLDGYACGRVTEDAFLDYVCGPAPKDGDA